jgi:P4 family phage/plasmid primase-like protien
MSYGVGLLQWTAEKRGKTYIVKIVNDQNTLVGPMIGMSNNFWLRESSMNKIKDALKKAVEDEKVECPTFNEDWRLSLSAFQADMEAEQSQPTFIRDGEITDKMVTDSILAENDFYCDSKDPNNTLYVYDNGLWHNGVAEGAIINQLSTIFDGEESRSKLMLDKTIIFIKGKAMKREVTPKPPHMISLANGVLDLTTMELNEHDPNLLVINQVPHQYDAKAECPAWLEWLGEVIKPEDTDFIQEWMGYNLYDAVPEAAFTVLTGGGQNGKTIFMDVFSTIIGELNVSSATFQDLTYSPYSMSGFYHMLANISDEIGSYVIKNTSRIKEVSSGSLTEARKIYGQPFKFRPYAKITYSCNTPPEIKDMSDAIKMRLKFVEFPHQFAKHPTGNQKQAEDRKKIMKALTREIPGIINWMLVGLKRLGDNDFTFTTSLSTDETWEFYRRKSLPVLAYFEECMTITDSDSDKVGIEELYSDFTDWIEEKGLKIKISRQKLIQDLRAEGVVTQQKREDDRKRMYYGVTLSRSNDLTPFASKHSNVLNNKKESGEGERGGVSERDAVTLEEYDPDTGDEGYPGPG